MKKIKCAYKDCKHSSTLEVEEHVKFQYCSIECACYDGAFSVKTGWNAERVKQKINGESSSW